MSFLTLANISCFTSATLGNGASGFSAFGNMSLSIAGDAYVTFFLITGTYSGPIGTITHDDGATLALNGGIVVDSPNETAAITDNFTNPGGAPVPFVLDYVSANGAPSVLVVTAVPEPSTWALMILGFARGRLYGLSSQEPRQSASRLNQRAFEFSWEGPLLAALFIKALYSETLDHVASHAGGNDEKTYRLSINVHGRTLEPSPSHWFNAGDKTRDRAAQVTKSSR